MEYRNSSLGHERSNVRDSSLHLFLSFYIAKAKPVKSSIISNICESALLSIMPSFNDNSDSLASFTLSIYVIGYCFGPLLIAPASELYGRIMVLYPSFIVYLASLAACSATTNIATFIVFRAVMRFAGITFLICERAVVADNISKERRMLALSLMTSWPTLVS